MVIDLVIIFLHRHDQQLPQKFSDESTHARSLLSLLSCFFLLSLLYHTPSRHLSLDQQAAFCLTPWLSAFQLDLQDIVSKEYNVVWC
jgi:hypothetical protein